jgi:hypothetical protein
MKMTEQSQRRTPNLIKKAAAKAETVYKDKYAANPHHGQELAP